jgi:hypothetical protein
MDYHAPSTTLPPTSSPEGVHATEDIEGKTPNHEKRFHPQSILRSSSSMSSNSACLTIARTNTTIKRIPTTTRTLAQIRLDPPGTASEDEADGKCRSVRFEEQEERVEDEINQQRLLEKIGPDEVSVVEDGQDERDDDEDFDVNEVDDEDEPEDLSLLSGVGGEMIPFLICGETCGVTYELLNLDEETFEVSCGRGRIKERPRRWNTLKEEWAEP